MRFFQTALLMAILAAAGLAAFSDGDGLTPTVSEEPGDYAAMRARDGGMGVPPTPAP
jgi:hypothetical protein